MQGFGPLLLDERALKRERSLQRVARADEHGERAVALAAGLAQHAIVASDEVANDLVMARDGVGHGLRRALPHANRAFDVGEDKSDDAAREGSGVRKRLSKDVGFDAAQLGTRLEAQRVDEGTACVLVRLERIRLPPASVESGHQLAPTPFVQWLGLDESLDPRQQLVVLAQCEPGVDQVLLRGVNHSFDSSCVPGRERPVGKLRKRRAATQRQGTIKRGGGHGRFSSSERTSSFRGQMLEAHHVDGFGCDVELVARPSPYET